MEPHLTGTVDTHARTRGPIHACICMHVHGSASVYALIDSAAQGTTQPRLESFCHQLWHISYGILVMAYYLWHVLLIAN